MVRQMSGKATNEACSITSELPAIRRLISTVSNARVCVDSRNNMVADVCSVVESRLAGPLEELCE